MSSAAPARATRGCYTDDAVLIPGAAEGPLKGLTAVVKDSCDIKGFRTSNGNPTWRSTHPAAAATSPAVQSLLDAGATIVGKCVMDELGYSLQGENFHYGTPVNPACPARIPGGSSSGTAAAVAAGDADIGLGGDTGGSVRVPASYCGLLGFRPTHGRVSVQHYCALAPSYDTVGLFARDPGVLRRAAEALLLPGRRAATTLRRWLVATDAFALAEEDAARAIYAALSARMDAIQAALGAPREVAVASGEGGEGGSESESENAAAPALPPALSSLESWAEVFRVHQGHEAWVQHGAWVEQHTPVFGPGVAERFAAAAAITDGELAAAARQRAAIRRRLDALLGADGILAVPSAPGPAPLLGTSSDAYRRRLIALTSIAGHAGLPQVSLPVATVGGCPVGLGLIGPRGSDEELLALAERLMAALAGR